jgi:hypothetical protein
VLESLYGAAVGEQASEAFTAWRLARTTEQAAAESFAYGGDIRRALMALEPISEADLSQLGAERANAIAVALTAGSAEFTARIRLQPPVAVGLL